MAVAAFTLAMLRAEACFVRFPLRFAFWCEYLPTMVKDSWPFVVWGTPQQDVVRTFLDELRALLFPVLIGLTLAQPVMRLRRPRPPWRELLRQAGFAGCLAMILGTLIVVDLNWITGNDLPAAVWLAPIGLLLWPTLGLRPWRSEASWMDRLGRGVGWGWLVLGGVAVVLSNL